MATSGRGPTARDQDGASDTGPPDLTMLQTEGGMVPAPAGGATMNGGGGSSGDGGKSRGSPDDTPDGAKDGTSAPTETAAPAAAGAAQGVLAGTNDDADTTKDGISSLGIGGSSWPDATDLGVDADGGGIGPKLDGGGVDGGSGGHSRGNSSIVGSSIASSSMDDDVDKLTETDSSEHPIDVCATPTRRNPALKGVDAEKLSLPVAISIGGESANTEEEAIAVLHVGSGPTSNAHSSGDAGGGQSIEQSVSNDDVPSVAQHGSTAPPQVGGASAAAAAPSAISPRSAAAGSVEAEGGGLPPRPPPGPNGGGVIRMPPQNGHHHQRQQQQQPTAPPHPAGMDQSTHSNPDQTNNHPYQQSPIPQQQAGSGVVKPPSPTNNLTSGGDTILQEPTTEEVSSSMDAIISSSPVQQSNENIVERSPGGRYLRFQEKLGSGAYKDVYRAYDTIEGIEVAWNVVNLAGVPKAERARIVHEVRLLERLHHKNIISFHGSWVNREKEQVIFVTEILSSGTLKSFINKVQVIRWKIAKRWAIQILKGLEYLHSQDPPIIHRDLKCDNIFINGTSGDLRIGDLGLSTVIDNKNKVRISFFSRVIRSETKLSVTFSLFHVRLELTPITSFFLLWHVCLSSFPQVLSVLGTPEFMAPELYDESYDEKVDIYAFGMCLLEIFTKEVPYRECANPAQIYKRVMNGIPPNSLSRVRNLEAKEFIILCLGTSEGRDPKSRPTAPELLRHPFLANRKADDNSEVEVDPTFDHQLGTVHEANSLGEVSILTASTKGPSSEVDAAQQHQQHPIQPVDSQDVSLRNPPGQQSLPQYQSTQSSQLLSSQTQNSAASVGGTDDDHFSGMPESETNMKKVKVLMGRGEEIEDDEYDDPSAAVRIPPPSIVAKGIARNTSSGVGSVEGDQQNSAVPESKYCAFAAVIDEEATDRGNPYEGDIMKLVITLPVEGKSQNVQFDFHLVQDDAVQVAKEMVSELDLPQDAVLEISETISGLARTARIKQGKRIGQQAVEQQEQMAMKTDSAESGASSLLSQNDEPPLQQVAGIGVPLIPAVPRISGSSIPSDQSINSLGAEQLPSSSLDRGFLAGGEEEGQEESSGQIQSADEIGDAESDDEFRQLEEAFQKNIHRAKKAFDTRMDNLQRSKVEKEARHLKTLEKHEREKADFDKRVKMAEEEQNRRLEKLEKELAKKKEELVKARYLGKPNSSSGEESDSDRSSDFSADDSKAMLLRVQSQDSLPAAVPFRQSTSQDRSRSTSISASDDSGSERIP